MGIELRLPNITGATEKEQLLQLKSYLYQLSEQLQWAFDNISTTGGSGNGYVVNQVPRGYSAPSSGLSSKDAEVTFAALKSLIIKSADIVDAYYEEINKRLEGIYIAESDFGKFAEKTEQNIEANSTAITQTFENVQIIIKNTKDEIDGDLETIGQDLSYAQQDVIVLKGNVEDINGNIANVEGSIGELDLSLQDTKVALNGNIDNAINNANAYTDAAKEEAKGYTDGAKSELDSKIGETASELDGKITDANGRIDETNGKVSDLGDGLVDANSRIEGVEGELSDTKTELNNRIQTVSDSVSTVDRLLASAKEDLKGSIDDLEFDLRGLMQIVIGVTAYIKSGLLYYTDAGVPVYGIEIGQEVESNGEKIFNKFSRFTSEKLSFYDANGNEVAYISDKKLYIGQAEITISFKVGGLIDLVMANGDVVTKWEGG